MVMQANVASFTLPENGYWDDTGTLQRYYRNNMRLSKNRNVISRKAQINSNVEIHSSVILDDVDLSKVKEIKKV